MSVGCLVVPAAGSTGEDGPGAPGKGAAGVSAKGAPGVSAKGAAGVSAKGAARPLVADKLLMYVYNTIFQSKY